jgi:hypothetical protein
MNLISLEEYKTFKGISGFTEDSKITPLISSVSQLIKTYCNRQFVDYYATDLTETFTITWETTVLRLRESPVVSITSVAERQDVSSNYVVLGASDFYLDTFTDSIYRVDGSGFTPFQMGAGAVRVIYKAGYSTCPEDLKLATIDMVNYYFKEDYKTARSIGTASMQGPANNRNIVGSAAFPDHIKRVLDLYRL